MMNKYNFSARSPTKKLLRGVINCESPEELKTILFKHNYELVHYHVVRNKLKFELTDHISSKNLISLCQKLYMMSKSGLSFSDSIEFVATSFHDSKLVNNLTEISKELKKGKELSTIFEAYPKYFPDYFKTMLALGENSGNMTEILAELVKYYQNEEKFKKSFSQALFYPCILGMFAVIVIVALNVIIIPNFKTILLDMKTELPSLTKIVFAISDFFNEYLIFVILGIIIVLTGIIALLKTKKGRHFESFFKLRISLMKRININKFVMQFSNILRVLTSSGLPIVSSIGIAARILNNPYLTPKFNFATDEIKRGVKLSDALATMNIFPEMYIETLKISDETGNLNYSLSSLSNIYEDESANLLKKLSSIIEPFFIIFIAFVIVIIIAAIYSPLFSLFDSLIGG